MLSELWIKVRRARIGALALVGCAAPAGNALIHAAAASAAPSAKVQIVSTNSSLTKRLDHLRPISFSTGSGGASTAGPTITVNDSHAYQQFEGVGAAMTDSSAYLIDRLPPAKRDQLIKNLVGNGAGAGFNILRVPMGASDFSAQGRPYTYDDLPRGKTDSNLVHFSIAHDQRYIIPLLKEAQQANPGIEYEAVPWTLPAWMKANDAYGNKSHAGLLLRQYYPAAAQYFVKFIQAYAAAGIRLDSIVPANEPDVATAYPGMQLPPEQEAVFIANYLLPALQSAGLDIKVFGDDLSWDKTQYASIATVDPGGAAVNPGTAALNSGAVLNLIQGNSYHCYHGEPSLMTTIHRLYPVLVERLDECSPGKQPGHSPVTMLTSLRDNASAILGWNLALDPKGGPVQAPNSGCKGCIGDATLSGSKVTYNWPYYLYGQIGQLVKFGARRIASNNASRLIDVAFANPSGTDSLVVYNPGPHLTRFTVNDTARAARYPTAIGAGEMKTYTWQR